MSTRNAGYICIDEKFLSKILDFEGATIWSASLDSFNCVKLLLEHPDLPELSCGEQIPIVNPIYTVSYGENGVIIRQERTDPPKTIK